MKTVRQQSGTAVVQLVTVNLDGSQIWALPLDEVKSFDFGRWGRLLVSTSQGLYEADVAKQSLQTLTPPATGMPLLYCPCFWKVNDFIISKSKSAIDPMKAFQK